MELLKTLNFEETELKMQKGKGIFEGYASLFNVRDSEGDAFLKGAFTKAINSQKTGRKTAMHFNHNTKEIPIGKWLTLEEDSKGFYVVGELTPNLSKANDIAAAVEHETITGLSVAGFANMDSVIKSADGRDIGEVATLREISVCVHPMLDEAQFSLRKSLDGVSTVRDIEDWLRDSANFSKSEAQTFISRFKSALLSDSEAEKQLALLAKIQSFKI